MKKTAPHISKINTHSLHKRGFTLIEIIVSLGIFSIVAVIAVGALVRVTGANRQAQSIQAGVNNVSFVLDAISREMRVGSDYHCIVGTDLYNNTPGLPNNPCTASLVDSSAGDVIIYFTSSNKDTNGNFVYAYLFHTDTGTGAINIYKAEETSYQQGINTVSANSAKFYPVTAQMVHITEFNVGIFGGTSFYPYAWAFIRLQGYVGAKVKDQSLFDAETSISQRSQG